MFGFLIFVVLILIVGWAVCSGLGIIIGVLFGISDMIRGKNRL